MRKNPFFPVYLYGIFVFVVSSLPTGKIEELQKKYSFLEVLLSDFMMHFVVFTLFAVLMVYGFYKTKKTSIPYINIGLISFAYGLFIEVFQIPIPYRSFNLDDLVADLLGIAFALIIFRMYVRARKTGEARKARNARKARKVKKLER